MVRDGKWMNLSWVYIGLGSTLGIGQACNVVPSVSEWTQGSSVSVASYLLHRLW